MAEKIAKVFIIYLIYLTREEIENQIIMKKNFARDKMSHVTKCVKHKVSFHVLEAISNDKQLMGEPVMDTLVANTWSRSIIQMRCFTHSQVLIMQFCVTGTNNEAR